MISIKAYSPMHKKNESTCSHNNKTVWVHILNIVKKSRPVRRQCYFKHLHFTLQGYHHWTISKTCRGFPDFSLRTIQGTQFLDFTRFASFSRSRYPRLEFTKGPLPFVILVDKSSESVIFRHFHAIKCLFLDGYGPGFIHWCVKLYFCNCYIYREIVVLNSCWWA